jgi:hypothetical protein
MPQTLPDLLLTLDRQRRELLAGLEGLSDTQLRARPMPGAWSLLEIVEHLVLAEAAILQDLPPRAQLVDQPRSLGQRFKLLLVVTILRCRIPVKVPSRRMVPTGQRGLAELRTQWDGHFQWLEACVLEATGDAKDKACFRHPIAGPITLAQALRLDLLHLRTHTRQIAQRRDPA